MLSTCQVAIALGRGQEQAQLAQNFGHRVHVLLAQQDVHKGGQQSVVLCRRVSISLRTT